MTDPLLHINEETGLWEGEDGERRVEMSNETFMVYVLAWFDFYKINKPTQAQIRLRAEYCRRLEYWRDCEKNYDPRVKVKK